MGPRERDAAENQLRIYELVEAALGRRDKVLEIVSSSANREEAEERIREPFNVEVPHISRAVLDLPVFRWTRSEREIIAAWTDELRQLLGH
jgi:DNA gyrase/topoisomerase IV subunit A